MGKLKTETNLVLDIQTGNTKSAINSWYEILLAPHAAAIEDMTPKERNEFQARIMQQAIAEVESTKENMKPKKRKAKGAKKQ